MWLRRLPVHMCSTDATELAQGTRTDLGYRERRRCFGRSHDPVHRSGSSVGVGTCRGACGRHARSERPCWPCGTAHMHERHCLPYLDRSHDCCRVVRCSRACSSMLLNAPPAVRRHVLGVPTQPGFTTNIKHVHVSLFYSLHGDAHHAQTAAENTSVASNMARMIADVYV